MERVPLSVIILTKNEAGRLRDCLESIRWAEEVLVIDDESTDETVALARSLGARVLQRKMDVEGRHRNWAHAHATHEWILSLDADERVTPELAEEIRALIARGAPHPLYAIPRRNYIGRVWLQHGGWYPSAQLKLFKKSAFRWEETLVHPRAIGEGTCGQTRHDLRHYSYRDLADFVAKLNRQTTLEAQKWIADGRGVTLGNAMWRSVDRFVRSYVGKRGYRDGRWGFIMAVMAGAYQFLSYAKVWERRLLRPSEGSARSVRHFSKRRNREKCQTLQRARLTVLLLTKNEEARLSACLEGLRWADELVVVDGQSTDRTREIAGAAGAVVIERPFSGSFAAERNAGLDAATGEWVLQMDADEEISPELRASVEALLFRGSPHAAFKVRRRNFFLGHRMRYGGWYHYNLVLFRRTAGRYEGLVHERLQVRGTIGVIHGDLIHRPFDSLSQFIDRQNRYTSLQAEDVLRAGPPVSASRLRYEVSVRPFKLWWKLYVKKQGFREGMHGLIFSLLFAWVHFLKWAKYWELTSDLRDDARSLQAQG